MLLNSKKLILLTLTVFIFSCANKRSEQITDLLSKLNTALNKNDGDTFKTCISSQAEDYKLIDDNWVKALTTTQSTNTNGTTNTFKYLYTFFNYDIPDSGKEIIVKADTSIKLDNAESGYPELNLNNYKSEFTCIEEGGFLYWGGEWKVKKVSGNKKSVEYYGSKTTTRIRAIAKGRYL